MAGGGRAWGGSLSQSHPRKGGTAQTQPHCCPRAAVNTSKGENQGETMGAVRDQSPRTHVQPAWPQSPAARSLLAAEPWAARDASGRASRGIQPSGCLLRWHGQPRRKPAQTHLLQGSCRWRQSRAPNAGTAPGGCCVAGTARCCRPSSLAAGSAAALCRDGQWHKAPLAWDPRKGSSAGNRRRSRPRRVEINSTLH